MCPSCCCSVTSGLGAETHQRMETKFLCCAATPGQVSDHGNVTGGQFVWVSSSRWWNLSAIKTRNMKHVSAPLAASQVSLVSVQSLWKASATLLHLTLVFNFTLNRTRRRSKLSSSSLVEMLKTIWKYKLQRMIWRHQDFIYIWCMFHYYYSAPFLLQSSSAKSFDYRQLTLIQTKATKKLKKCEQKITAPRFLTTFLFHLWALIEGQLFILGVFILLTRLDLSPGNDVVSPTQTRSRFYSRYEQQREREGRGVGTRRRKPSDEQIKAATAESSGL